MNVRVTLTATDAAQIVRLLRTAADGYVTAKQSAEMLILAERLVSLARATSEEAAR